MKPILKAGLVLGILVEIWTYVLGIAGWYKDPVLLNLFYGVILIEIGVLIWGLRLTAAEGRGYGGQVAAGLIISVIGAVVIFVGSFLFTSVVFPNYFTELNDMYRQIGPQQGLTSEQIEAEIASMAGVQTPFMNALIGAVMTIVTGLVASLIIAVFIRKKSPAAAPAS